MDSGEPSTAVESDDQPITIVVKDQAGDEIMFKIKKSTKMRKVFDAYSQKKGVDVNSLRFLQDGSQILPDSTPKMLELSDNDQIDVFLQQVGGY